MARMLARSYIENHFKEFPTFSDVSSQLDFREPTQEEKELIEKKYRQQVKSARGEIVIIILIALVFLAIPIIIGVIESTGFLVGLVLVLAELLIILPVFKVLKGQLVKKPEKLCDVRVIGEKLIEEKISGRYQSRFVTRYHLIFEAAANGIEFRQQVSEQEYQESQWYEKVYFTDKQMSVSFFMTPYIKFKDQT